MAEREGLFGFRVASAKTSSLTAFGTACRRPARAVLAGRTQDAPSTLPLHQIKKPPTRGGFLIWRRGRDSNPRYGVTVRLISSQVHSTTLPPLRRARILPATFEFRAECWRTSVQVRHEPHCYQICDGCDCDTLLRGSRLHSPSREAGCAVLSELTIGF